MANAFLKIQHQDKNVAPSPCLDMPPKAVEQALVRAQGVGHPNQTLILDDPETKKQEVCKRLQAEGVMVANKQLAAPWDFNAILVIAPECDAGLDDFYVSASRLEKFNVCRFTYARTQFQGEYVAKNMIEALHLALLAWSATKGDQPDAVVIICGGGQANNRAWLNDYELARCICDLPIPVLTGIGHAPVRTVLDEVAHGRFDSPSMLMAGIQNHIVERVAEVKTHFSLVTRSAVRLVQSAKMQAEALNLTIRAESRRQLAKEKQSTAELLPSIRSDALQQIHSATSQSQEVLQLVQTEAMAQLSQVRLERQSGEPFMRALEAINGIENLI